VHNLQSLPYFSPPPEQSVVISELAEFSDTEVFFIFFVITGVNAAVMQEITIKLIKSSIKEKAEKDKYFFLYTDMVLLILP